MAEDSTEVYGPQDFDATGKFCGTGGTPPPIGDPTYGDILLYAYESTNGIRVSWTYVTDLPWGVSSITVYRSKSNTFGETVKAIWTGMSSNYLDTPEDLEIETRYYYWIRITSVNGTDSRVVGPANAMMKTATELTVQNLYDSITETELYSDLNTEINKISDFQTALDLQDVKFTEINSIIGGVLDGFEADLLANGVATLDEIVKLQRADSNTVLALEGMAASFNSNFSGILKEQIVYADATSALAQEVLRLEASIEDPYDDTELSALVEQNMQATADLEEGVRANWTVKVNATNQYGTSIAGIGLEVTDKADQNVPPTSTFIVTADRFAIIESGNDPSRPVIPFAVGQVTDPYTGVTQSTVVITKAMIADASIDTLRVAGGAIVQGTVSLPKSQTFTGSTFTTLIGGDIYPIGGIVFAQLMCTVVCGNANKHQIEFRIQMVNNSTGASIGFDNTVVQQFGYGVESNDAISFKSPIAIQAQHNMQQRPGEAVYVQVQARTTAGSFTLNNAVLTIEAFKR